MDGAAKSHNILWRKSFPRQNGEKVENLFTKKFAGKRKKCLTERHTVRYTVELQACPHFGTRIDPITGDEFLRRIQPWRELFSPRSVSARKFMAFWPAWAPRTAARSSMLAVQRAARAWLSDLKPCRWDPAQKWICAQKTADIPLAVLFFYPSKVFS